MRRLALALLALAAASAAGARADDGAVYGTIAPSGSVFTSEITPLGDTDDFTFQGWPGMTVTATVKPTKGSILQPDVQIIRPDGGVATDDDTFLATQKGTAVVATMTLNSPGWWVVRVLGKNPAGDYPTDPKQQVSFGYSVQVVYKMPSSTTAFPVLAKSFVKKAAIDSRSDVDEYPFQGYDKQTVSATITVAKGGTLFPSFDLVDPSGKKVDGATTAFDGKSATLTNFTMNADGIWRLRIAGLEHPDDGDPKKNSNTTGPYTLSVKLGKIVPSIAPDASGQYRFIVPAVGGATVGYTFSVATGGPPTLAGFLDPNGHALSPGDAVKGNTRTLTGFVIPSNEPIGNYVVAFGAPGTTGASFQWHMTPPKPLKGVKQTLAKLEPIVVQNGVYPKTGAAGTTVTVTTTAGQLLDPNNSDASKIGLFLDHVAFKNVTVNENVVSGVVPDGLPIGPHDVIVTTSTGQVAVAARAFEIIPPPTLSGIEPNVGSFAGGYPITISGAGFGKLTDPRIVINSLGNIVPVHIVSTTDTAITFTAPAYGTAGTVQFGVVDSANGVGRLLLPGTFEFISSPAISRLVPNLTSVLGGDTIIVTGANFNPTDSLYVENAPPGSGVYTKLTGTYVSATRHQFTAPVRVKGSYHVYVVDQFGQPLPPRTRILTYFQYTDLNVSQQGVLPSGSDLWDGVTTASADYDGDGAEDLFISRVGSGPVNATSQTRVLHNDGAGHFTDVTSSVMPAVTSADDWRADRIWVTDMDRSLDGFPDICIVTNDQTVPPAGSSHVRILVNEMNGTAHVFRDRTTDLFCPPRTANGGSSSADNWRGLDMWIGDVDRTPGQPEIIITHKETKQELDVYCSPYCASPTASFYTYGFYWGGSREFHWDKSKAGGLGQYRFNRDFFPRKAGLRVPVIVPNNGGTLPICNSNYGKPCVNRFTPFLGKRIAVSDLDVDANGIGLSGFPDVAVVSDDVVQRIYPPPGSPYGGSLATISSLQVAIQRFNTSDGALVTDVTDTITALGGDNTADAIAIGYPGYPDGAAYGFIAITKAAPTNGLGIRIFKFVAPPVTVPPTFAAWQDVTTAMMPSVPPIDRWQASALAWKDVDGDGAQDLVLVANAAPGGTEPALRILRNNGINSQVGVMRENYKQLITGNAAAGVPSLITSSEHLEGDALTIGDVNKDGAVDFILTRKTTTSPAPETRIIVTDRGP